MRILQVGSGLHDWGGIERYVATLSQGLADIVQVEATVPADSPLDRRLSIARHRIAVRHKHDLRALLAYLKLFKRERYDVVHVHFNPDFLIVPFAARKRHQGPVVMSRHVALPWSPGKVRLYTRGVRRIVPVSVAVKRVLLASGVPEDLMTVAKAGTPTPELGHDRLLVRHRMDIEGFAVGYFGRLTPEKGVSMLLEATRNPAFPGTAYVFGRGPLEADLRAAAHERFRPMGYVEDVAEAMAAMDVIVVPSQWEEAFPYSVLEAMALGRPVVGTRTGGLPELVEPGKTGLLFEKSDVQALAVALTMLANDEPLREQMGENALARHRAEYTVQAMTDRMLRVYVDVVRSM
jgi:glycosyltransferase involved in cell wall biosynthesis